MPLSEKDKLSHEDIKALMDNPSADMKIQVIEKLSHQYNEKELTSSQVQLAEQIFRLLMKQAEIEVRKALSENLMTSDVIPADVVNTLARDVEEVSLPILEFSEVLSDDDLVDIIQSTKTHQAQLAIASRSNVSQEVSGALVETHDAEVVETLLHNDQADISDTDLEQVVDEFAESKQVVESVITRNVLPPRIVEHLTKTVSTAIQKDLETKYKKSFSDIRELFQESGEVAALTFMGMDKADKDLLLMIDDLERHGQLLMALQPGSGVLSQMLDKSEKEGCATPLAALAVGHLRLFEITMARFTGVPFSNVRKLVADDEAGLKALYERASLPPKLYEAVQVVVRVIKFMEKEARRESGARACDDLPHFIKLLMQAANEKRFHGLSYFITAIRKNMKSAQEDW